MANISLDERVIGNDGPVNNKESIQIEIESESGLSDTIEENKVKYKFWFTDVTGKLLTGTQAKPLAGEHTLGTLTGTIHLEHELDLVDSGSFSFSHMHLELTYTGKNVWNFHKIQVKIGADNIKVTPDDRLQN